MSGTTSTTGVGRGGSVTGDLSEIRSLPDQQPPGQVLKANLQPEEQALSLPPEHGGIVSPIAPLTQFFGPVLTVANPVWSGDPIPGMRALQKKLVEHALTLKQEERSVCMSAITIVEQAVQLRLRLQQMRMTEADLDDSQDGKSNGSGGKGQEKQQ